MNVLYTNRIKLMVLATAVFFAFQTVRAQDGANLFKQNCAACHKLEGSLVGPGLKGVQEKWAEAGEAENLLLWVKNSAAIYEGGTSEMAKVAWEFSPTEMTAQAHLSDEEIKAIFDYVASAEIPVEKEVSTSGTKRAFGAPLSERIYSEAEKAQLKKENDQRKLVIFMVLILTALCLVMGIVSVSKTIQTFSVLQLRKDDGNNSGNKTSVGSIATVMLLLTMLAPFSGYSLGFNAESSSWLVISSWDIIFLFVGNIVLLFVLLEQKKTLRTMVGIYDEELLKKEAAEEKDQEVTETVLNLLTDVVPIEDEEAILLDHDYDGIKELDNNLPPWWVWSFAATVVAAFIYLMHFHVLGTGDLQTEAYEKELAAEQLRVDAYMSAMAMNVDENNVVVLTDLSDLAKGQSLYTINCVVCHKENGEGLVGPNLTDDHWLTGNDIKTVFTTIKYGTSNGMPEHESKMNPVELQQVASYILTMEYTEGKAPEGEKIEK